LCVTTTCVEPFGKSAGTLCRLGGAGCFGFTGFLWCDFEGPVGVVLGGVGPGLPVVEPPVWDEPEPLVVVLGGSSGEVGGGCGDCPFMALM
jgi:hypothetical protein